MIMLVTDAEPRAARPRAEVAAAALLRARRLRRAGREPGGGGRARGARRRAASSVGAPRYVASQPWPFPASLMLGFEVPWTGGEPRAQEEEIQDVRWFSRAEVAAAAALDGDGWGGAPEEVPGDGLLLPPRLAIARRLLERWLARGD